MISCALRAGKDLRVWSLAEPEQNEAEIIQRFFDGIEKFTPQVVSWNGGGFDLPVLHYRGLIHGVVAPRYWDLGDGDTVSCGKGTEWHYGVGEEPSPTCGHTYTEQGRFTVEATSYWTADWSGYGQSGSFAFELTRSQRLDVGELQVIVTSGR